MRGFDEVPARPIPVEHDSAIEWHSRTTGDLISLTGRAPRGRKGLWAALVAASGEVEGTSAVTITDTGAGADAESESGPTDAVPLAQQAHLAYLARVASPGADDPTGAPNPETGPMARVVDIDVFRARCRRHHR